DLPVLRQDADPEIVEIFLEEASGVLASISLNIPEWIQQPENTELLEEIRRSLHTLKGSGRMAGAMLMGEFAWSIEALLNKLVEGSVRSGGSLFALLSQVPQAASGLLRQLQDGGEPDMDIGVMMQKAADLASASPAASSDHAAEDERDAEVTVDAEMSASEDDDIVLMELFSTECSEHLGTLAASNPNTGEPGMVTDALYRALHTLTGISESADVPGIGRLAAALYDYFGELYQEGRPAAPEAFALLDDCVREMSSQLQRLPDRNHDEDVVHDLLGQIAALPAAIVDVQEEEPRTAEESAAPEAITDDAEATFDEIPELPAAAMPAYDEQAAGSPGIEGQDVTEQDRANQYAIEESDEPSTPESGVEAPVQGEGDIYSGMDQELYEIFVEEATEIIDSSESSLRNWSESPDDRDLMAEFQRLLHTLKGGARMVDVQAIGDLSHALESLLTQVVDGAVAANDDLFALLQESHDRLAEMLEKVKSRAVIDAATDLEARLAGFRRGESGAAATEDHAPERVAVADPAGAATEYTTPEAADKYQHAAEHGEDDDSEPEVADIAPHSGFDAVASDNGLMVQALAAHPQTVERRKEGRSRSELVRVQSDVLDNLVNNAGEINIYRSRMEQQISNFSFNLTEFDQTISRLRDQLRQLEMETEAQILFRYELEAENRNQDFDPLEMDRYSKLQQLSRSLIESISDLRSLHDLMDVTTRESETLLLQQSRVSTDLQEGLIRTRMIPFAGLAPRLRRIVRQSARQLDKKVDLHLRGAEGEMDRAVIERIVAPLEHMLRNAVAHGIETPEQRKNAGKRVAGTITIDFNREGTEIVLRISDDGAGLDIDAIRARAIERGLMGADTGLPDSDVMQFVLQTGFSTASEVTQISGRGVGMDVVNSEVKQLGGSLHIDSVSGEGSVFTIRLPYTLAINQALLITIGEQVFCVPMGSIEGVVTASTEQLQSCYEDSTQEFGYAGHNYQLMHLGSLLGISRMDLENAGTQIPVLLVRTGDKRIGMQVDSLLGSREVVIKPLGAQLSLVDGVSGATILGDGRVVMILDMFAISRMKVREQSQMRPAGSLEDSRLLVMVVDDSITVRKVTTRLLERSGYRVMTAKDGVDAMGQLQEVVPDMMLLDIEMPRMDGFELATHMRNDERLKHVPIIMITSRTGDKHRERAFEIGVNEYLGKPYQESELLTSINNIIGVNTVAVRA
ncbi:MAG: Hpt domain-containing protein, partial [Gammaproteobacteria bacterium]